jgi:hypothetical protein
MAWMFMGGMMLGRFGTGNYGGDDGDFDGGDDGAPTWAAEPGPPSQA